MSRTRWLAAVLGLAALGGGLWLWTSAGVGPSAPRPAAPAGAPNVLVILWDTTRADRLGVYGYAKDTTPRLDAWAKDAVVFERAVAPEMWTPPTHASLFTGFAPKHHGVKATYKWLDEHHTTLAEWLGAHGWDTFLWSANPYVAPETNLADGFDTVATTFQPAYRKEARKLTRDKLIPEDRSTDISPGWKGKRVVGDVHPYKDAAPLGHRVLVDWLADRAEPERPWFAFVNMMEVHIPRVPSLESREALLDADTLKRGLNTPVSQIDLLSYTFGKHDYTADELAAISGVYDAALRDMDAATFALLDALQASGALDNTLVVLTADHGENLGDHHMFGHKFGVYDTLLHVPLLLRWDGHLPPRRVAEPVSELSVFATILDAAGLPAPTPGPDLTTSLLDDIRPSPLFSDLLEATPVSIRRVDARDGIDDKARWLRTFRAVEAEGWKLVLASDGTDELFHLPEDPAEATDVSDAHPDRVQALTTLRDAWDAAVPAYDGSRRTDADAPVKVDDATRAMLGALGYNEKGEEAEAP